MRPRLVELEETSAAVERRVKVAVARRSALVMCIMNCVVLFLQLSWLKVAVYYLFSAYFSLLRAMYAVWISLRFCFRRMYLYVGGVASE